MATNQRDIKWEILHFEQFKEHIPGWATLDKHTIEYLLVMGGLQISTLFEQAIANRSKWLHESKRGQDLADGSDAKYATCRRHGHNKQCYSAYIGGLHNKRGDLRVQVLCPLGDFRGENQFYWFIIPYEAYSHINRPSGNLEIPFSPSGTPLKTGLTKQGTANLWRYQVANFDIMAISNSKEESRKRNQIAYRHFDTLFQ